MTILNNARPMPAAGSELAWEPDDAWKKALKDKLDAEATAKVEKATQEYFRRSDDVFFDLTLYNQYHETIKRIRKDAEGSYSAGIERERQERKRWAFPKDQWDLLATFSAKPDPIALPPVSPNVLIFIDESQADTGAGIIVDSSPVFPGTLFSGASAPALGVPTTRDAAVGTISPVLGTLWDHGSEDNSTANPIPASPGIRLTKPSPTSDAQRVPDATPALSPSSPGPAAEDLEVWEERLSRQERSLDRREEIVGGREREVSRELSAFQRKKDGLREREEKLGLREQSLERRGRTSEETERGHRRRDESLQRKVDKLKEDEIKLDRRRKECEERAGELDIIKADLDQKLARANLNLPHDRPNAAHAGWSSSTKASSSRPLTPESPDGFRHHRSSTFPHSQYLSPDNLSPNFTKYSPGSSSSKLPPQTPSPLHRHRATPDDEQRGRDPGVSSRSGPEIREPRPPSHPRKRSTTPTPPSTFGTKVPPGPAPAAPASPRPHSTSPPLHRKNPPANNLFGESPPISHQHASNKSGAPPFHPPMAHKPEKSTTKRERQIKSKFAAHEKRWATLSTEDLLRWHMFPWPMLKEPSNLDDITIGLISEYIHSPLYPDQGKLIKERVRDQLKRWHPDRFDAPFLPKVRAIEREEVREGAGLVTRHLTSILSSDRTSSL